MLDTTQLNRIFLYKDNGQEIRLSDPSPKLAASAVLNFYANTYPLLTTATIQGPEIQNDEIQYRFVSTLGTKG
ncbi:MAG: PRTRC system protein C [Bacteroidota bacterium]